MRKALFAMTALWPIVAVAQATQTSCAVPAPAAAVGYNTRTLGPNITLGQPWIKDTRNGTTANVTMNKDGSVTVAGGGDTWNGQLETYVGGRGAAFGGGFYAQATMSVPGPTSCLASFDHCGNETGPGNQWPSFWANSTGNTIETDFVEIEDATPGQYQATVINWTTKPQTGYGQTITAPAGDTLHGPHTYSFLWIPATATGNGSMTFYLDGQPVGDPITWTRSKLGLYGIIDGQQMVIRLGAGANSPATFSNVEVWQANSSQDIGVTTSAKPCARPTLGVPTVPTHSRGESKPKD
jgi:hypothetical protein